MIMYFIFKFNMLIDSIYNFFKQRNAANNVNHKEVKYDEKD